MKKCGFKQGFAFLIVVTCFTTYFIYKIDIVKFNETTTSFQVKVVIFNS